MKIIIHGGANQIGGNCVEVISENTRLIIDTGIPITNIDGTPFDSSMFNTLSGKELLSKGLIPDIKGVYFWDKPEINGVLLSHYHRDHYGWIKYVHPEIPCYLGEVSHRLIDSIGVMNKKWEKIIKNPCYIKSWESFSIGNITVFPFLIDHSACDSYIFVLESEGKRIVYTGDFRNHGRKGKLFGSFLEQCPLPVNLLITEGTCLSNKKHEVFTEEKIEEEIIRVCKATKGFVLGYTSTQNIDRIVSFYKGALKSNRFMVIDPYQAYILDQVGWKVPKADGNYKIKVMYPYFISKRIAKIGNKEILYRYKKHKITKEELKENPEKYLIMVRNTMLKDLKLIGNMEQSRLIYSLWQGYKEESKLKNFLSEMKKLGTIIIDIHSSGHANFDTIKELVNKIQPEKLIPVHGEHRELFKTISDCVIKSENGLKFEF